MRVQGREPVDVVSATPLEGKYLLFEFSDGVRIPINLERFMRGPIFDEVFASGTFGNFAVDADSGTIVWPNGADLDPEVLRYSSDTVDADADLAEKARKLLMAAPAFWGWHSEPKRRRRPSAAAASVTHRSPMVQYVVHSNFAGSATGHFSIKFEPSAIRSSSAEPRPTLDHVVA